MIYLRVRGFPLRDRDQGKKAPATQEWWTTWGGNQQERRRNMPTFRFNSERPYYREGRLVKKVRTEHQIGIGALDCAILGWTGLRLVTKLTSALIFKRTPYRLL